MVDKPFTFINTKTKKIITKVRLNSTDILKQNRQIHKFLANNFTQQYNPLNIL